MIRINLAPPEGRPRRGGGGPGFSLPSLPEFNLGMLFLVLYVATGAGAGYWWLSTMNREASLTVKLKQTKDELEKLKVQVGTAGKI